MPKFLVPFSVLLLTFFKMSSLNSSGMDLIARIRANLEKLDDLNSQAPVRESENFERKFPQKPENDHRLATSMDISGMTIYNLNSNAGGWSL